MKKRDGLIRNNLERLHRAAALFSLRNVLLPNCANSRYMAYELAMWAPENAREALKPLIKRYWEGEIYSHSEIQFWIKRGIILAGSLFNASENKFNFPPYRSGGPKDIFEAIDMGDVGKGFREGIVDRYSYVYSLDPNSSDLQKELTEAQKIFNDFRAYKKTARV